MKNVVITGVSGGMGSAAAKRFLKEGYQVFGLDLKAPTEIDNMHFIQTDLTDVTAIQHAFKEVSSHTDHVDCILHLAGIYELNSLVEISEEDFLRIFQINVFAAYRINKTFLPLLSEGGRIVMTSSELAPLDPLPFTGIYGITKTTIEKYAYSLRMELQLLGIKVIVLRPGAVDTGLLDVSTQKLDKFTENTQLYSYNAKRFQQIVRKVESRKIMPEKIAELAYKVAVAPHPKYVYKINRNPGLLLLNALPQRWQNGIIRWILKKA